MEAEITGSEVASRLNAEAGAVRSSTLALASYWLGAIRQYSRHASSKPPSRPATKRRLRTRTRHSSRSETEPS